jgi:transcriptional regulator with XRE-family HTH domain
MPDRHGERNSGAPLAGNNYAQCVVAMNMPPAHSCSMDQMSRLREERGLSQSQLAEMVGANQATISKIERGLGNPTLTMIRRIAKALDCQPPDLFSRDALQVRLMSAINSIDPEQQEAALTVIEAMAQKK